MKNLGVTLVLVTACASGASSTRESAITRITRSPGAQSIAREAPEAWAEVTRVASSAQGAEGLTETELAVTWGMTQARAAEARRRVSEAEHRRTEADTEASRMEQQVATQQAEIERAEAASASAQRATAAASAPERVAATERVAVAADLRQQAGLMLAAARMLGAPEASTTAAAARIDAADVASRGNDVALQWTSAGRAYAAAEALLRSTRSGAAATSTPRTDSTALHTELSNGGGMDPHRDARGVVAVLRGMFAGVQVAPAARERVDALARVVNHHTDARVRVEVFVGGAARATAEGTARAQAQSLAAALERAGVAHDRIASDGLYRVPNGARTDDRVEVVLVLPGET